MSLLSYSAVSMYSAERYVAGIARERDNNEYQRHSVGGILGYVGRCHVYSTGSVRYRSP